MSYMYSSKFMIFNMLYGQAVILLLSIVNTYYPQYLTYTFIVFIIAMFITMMYTMRTSFKHVMGGEAKEVRGGRKLVEVKADEVMSIVKYDSKLNEELRPMMKTSLLSLVNMVVILAWYYVYFNMVIHYFEGGDLTYKFIGFLIGYEVPFIGLTLINFITRRSQKVMIQVVNSYTIYDKGIVGSGIVVKFPLSKEYSVSVDPLRKFVEITKADRNITIRYRFYSKNVDRISDIINRFGKAREGT